MPPTQPTRADVPGALDHASSDVDEFDAALVRGAEGVAAAPDLEEDEEQQQLGGSAEPEPEPEHELQVPVASSSDGGVRDGGGGAVVAGGEQERAPAAQPRSGNRAIAFLRASWAELQRVQWPDRRQVTQATAVVLGFVVISGVYLGVADFVAKEIVEFVLG
jgi:preprotein translocase subunit SecE